MVTLAFGDVRKKRIGTPNHFVSHMIEHIAWRMGLSIDLETDSDNWEVLGENLGSSIAKLDRRASEGAALGMIDDGCATAAITFGAVGVSLTGAGGVLIDEFQETRCEQLSSGGPLVELLQGLSRGLNATIDIVVWSFEDTHHSWEGVFRGVGVALSYCFKPQPVNFNSQQPSQMLATHAHVESGELQILRREPYRATVERRTAESAVTVSVEFSPTDDQEQLSHRAPMAICRCDVDLSISYGVQGLEGLFTLLAQRLGARVEIDFIATKLSSSHVVMEDIGLVMGRALLEVLKLRMELFGVNGAGSTIKVPTDIGAQDTHVGVSVEGRKFWRFIPQSGDYNALRRAFMIGQNCMGGLRSEDLDDFIDGLAGGMSASIVIQVCTMDDPDRVWREVFSGLGAALHEVFEANPCRKGVPPGVKATLS